LCARAIPHESSTPLPDCVTGCVTHGRIYPLPTVPGPGKPKADGDMREAKRLPPSACPGFCVRARAGLFAFRAQTNPTGTSQSCRSAAGPWVWARSVCARACIAAGRGRSFVPVPVPATVADRAPGVELTWSSTTGIRLLLLCAKLNIAASCLSRFETFCWSSDRRLPGLMVTACIPAAADPGQRMHPTLCSQQPAQPSREASVIPVVDGCAGCCHMPLTLSPLVPVRCKLHARPRQARLCSARS
jgi:hypothetical protein